MTKLEDRKQEALEIVLAAAVGDATDSQLARLSQFVTEDESVALFVVQLLSQEAWLTWHGSQARSLDALAELPLSPPGYVDGGVEKTGASLVERLLLEGNTSFAEAYRQSQAATATVAPRRSSPAGNRRDWWTSGLSAAVLVGVGMMFGAMLARWVNEHDRVAVVLDDAGAPQDEDASRAPVVSSPHVARFVKGTACIWGPEMTSLPLADANLRRGESLNLMEGVAEVELQLAARGAATLQIEGPARMVLTAEGAPSLGFGKFSADVNVRRGDFTLDTPFGQVTVTDDSSLGVAVFGTEIEVHVFSGRAVVASPWIDENKPLERFTVGAGESLRLAIGSSGVMTADRGGAEPEYFTSQVSMTTDDLPIADAYVDEVRRAAPLVYWRFESAVEGTVSNEMGERFQGCIHGRPEWALQDGNRAVEFRPGLAGESPLTYIESSDTFERLISDSYSVEAWVKPSHYHLGAIVSFVRDSPDDALLGQHGMLLELGGPLAAPTSIEHPGRVRFLHRNPPSDDISLGMSCFSDRPYPLRRWAHVVAVKDGPEMRLYVNGEMVASAEANTQLPDGLALLVGQLDRHRDWRRFVGQLDELAVYTRALSDREIRRHYELVRPRKVSQQAI